MRILILIITLVISFQSNAASIMDGLNINGFGTFTYQRSDSEAIYYDSITNKNNFFLGTKAGISLNRSFSNEWDFTMMFLAKADRNGEITPHIDILQAAWKPNSNFVARVGRFRLPVWMISEYLEVGILIPWIRPPDEVYATIPLEEINGLNASYNFELSDLYFNIDAFTGVGALETSGDSKVQGTLDNVFGGVLSVNYDFLSLRGSYTQGDFASNIISTTLTPSGTAGSQVEVTVITEFNLGRTKMLSLGFKSEWENTYFLAEYAKWEASSNIVKENQGYYLLGGYYFLDKSLFTHFTYSRTTKVDSQLSFYQGRQESYIYGLNYSINQNLMTKLELRRVKPEGKAFFNKDLMGEDIHILGASIDFVF
ncbi:hypothetical protein [Halobacteriovorax sp. HLS]|uniref:hypothetical protein n=1 Tax=Halobacteriovorax sp. HLS TaxID=2234000 RepID=UPI000FDB7F46|nr:hypothetical protein [Halobacteriovorax sp. HLS]